MQARPAMEWNVYYQRIYEEYATSETILPAMIDDNCMTRICMKGIESSVLSFSRIR